MRGLTIRSQVVDASGLLCWGARVRCGRRWVGVSTEYARPGARDPARPLPRGRCSPARRSLRRRDGPWAATPAGAAWRGRCRPGRARPWGSLVGALAMKPRVLIGDYLLDCLRSIEVNLIEGQLHCWELLDWTEKEEAFIGKSRVVPGGTPPCSSRLARCRWMSPRVLPCHVRYLRFPGVSTFARETPPLVKGSRRSRLPETKHQESSGRTARTRGTEEAGPSGSQLLRDQPVHSGPEVGACGVGVPLGHLELCCAPPGAAPLRAPPPGESARSRSGAAASRPCSSRNFWKQ